MKKKDVYQKISCNLCGSERYQVLIKPKKRMMDPKKILSASGGVMGTQRIVRCSDCGLAYVNPRLKPGLVVKSYSEADDSLYASQAEARMSTFEDAFRFVEKYSPKRGRMLDVGAAAGFFLKVAKDKGWKVYGVEPSKWSTNFANKNYKVNVKQGVLKKAKFRANFFDVVTMWDVLEHVPDPTAELKEIFRILKPGGVLVVNYPDFGTPMARLAGSKWWFLLSVHLFYFDRKSLTKLLSKAGFSRIKFEPYWQSLSLGHLAKMVALYNKPASKFLTKIFGQLGFSKLKVKYYASQTNAVCFKEKA